jgi:hypothetical protein
MLELLAELWLLRANRLLLEMYHLAVKLDMKFFVVDTICAKLQRALLAQVMYLRNLYRSTNNLFKEQR